MKLKAFPLEERSRLVVYSCFMQAAALALGKQGFSLAVTF